MEPKRVNLVPVGPVQEPKKTEEIKRTYRFSVALTESTDKTCPEFSFHEMVKGLLVSIFNRRILYHFKEHFPLLIYV